MLNFWFNKIKKYPNKLKQEVNKISLIQNREENICQKLREQHCSLLPKLDRENKIILSLLEQEGNYVTSIDQLKIASSDSLLKVVVPLIAQLKLSEETNSQSYQGLGLTKSTLINYPEIFLWGLEEKLLDLIENYIGLPIIYQGLSMRRDLADAQQTGVKQWHLDWEDRRMIKIIIYLNDVDLEGGPYQYISRNLTIEALKKFKQNSIGFISEQEMEKLINPSDWQTCTGAIGTVIISDTGNIFHRAKPAVKNERFSLTFCYTSIRPQVMWTDKQFSQAQWQRISSKINQRQKNCLQERYWFD